MPPPVIQMWYGTKQRFGHLGRAQRWVNVLGNISGGQQALQTTYRLNGAAERALSLGSDLHRLARPGDFNIELAWDELRTGENSLVVNATCAGEPHCQSTVTLDIEESGHRSLPCHVDFTRVTCLQDVVQIVDGDWVLVGDGVRTKAPYYDRVLSLGDLSWTDVDVTARLTIHAFTPPSPGPPTYDVTHMGLALRWHGHHQDGEQPSRKWYPLGAQGEFLLCDPIEQSHWRILFDQMPEKPPVYSKLRNSLTLGQPVWMRAQVVTLPDGRSRYRFRQWCDATTEPDVWDVEGFEVDDLTCGSVCLVPHNSDVTIHEVHVRSLQDAAHTGSKRDGE